jgi:hypothetical protein
MHLKAEKIATQWFKPLFYLSPNLLFFDLLTGLTQACLVTIKKDS